MTSDPHAIVNELFRSSCELAAELLPGPVVARLQGLVPESAPSEVARVKSAEHRADSLTIYRDEHRRVRFAVVVEVQHTKDWKKRWTWPHYVAGVRVRYHCPTYLLVVALDASIARWARSVIALGHPGFELRPLVVSAKDVPVVESLAKVKCIPELAVLSALAHKSVAVATVALAGIDKLGGEQAVTYSDAILEAVPTLVQQIEENEMLQNYKFRSPFFRKAIARWKREAKKDGMEKGMEKGIQKGMEKGIQKGMEKGIQKGMEKGIQKGMEKARQSMLLEVARAKLGTLSTKEAQELQGISDEARLSALLVEVAQAQGARQVRAALARARAAPAAPRGRTRTSPSFSRRAA